MDYFNIQFLSGPLFLSFQNSNGINKKSFVRVSHVSMALPLFILQFVFLCCSDYAILLLLHVVHSFFLQSSLICSLAHPLSLFRLLYFSILNFPHSSPLCLLSIWGMKCHFLFVCLFNLLFIYLLFICFLRASINTLRGVECLILLSGDRNSGSVLGP